MPEITRIGAVPTRLEFEKALMFFHAYMYGPLQGKLRIYGARMISTGAVAASRDWEVFASMLVDDVGQKLVAGIDLTNYEVKSAKAKGSYEYQYHKNSGRDKLLKDAKVGHLFFEYSENLREVNLRYMHGSDLSKYFDKWLEEFPETPEGYVGERFRKQIPYGEVMRHGRLIMKLVNGEVAYPITETKEEPTASVPTTDVADPAEE